MPRWAEKWDEEICGGDYCPRDCDHCEKADLVDAKEYAKEYGDEDAVDDIAVG